MVQSIIEALRSIGALGVFLIAILDSSFLSIPEINDIIVVSSVAKRPELFFYWPLLTTAGSVIGCLLLYLVARKGGQVFLHRWFSARRVKTIEMAFARYGSLALIIPALWPPPLPFKTFVATAGVLQFPLRRFLFTITLARAVRYYGEALLAVLYGKEVEAFLVQHSLMLALIIVAVVTIAFFVHRLIETRLEAKSVGSAPAKNGSICA